MITVMIQNGVPNTPPLPRLTTVKSKGIKVEVSVLLNTTPDPTSGPLIR
ncbi:MAG: hypothetical protein M1553_14135 [Firmicutes bacterium]|nr:hypothetical protein [Bacillota bacterium]